MCCHAVIVCHGPTRGPKSAEPDKSAGRTVHSQISHEVTQLLDIKSQWGGGGSADRGGAKKKSNNPEDVFLTVMIILLVPSLEKGMSRYCKYTSYQGKENYQYHNYLFRCVSVCTCLWWVIAAECCCAGQAQLCRKEAPSGYRCSRRTLTSSPGSAADVFFSAPGGKTWQENCSGDRDAAQKGKHYVIFVAQFLKTNWKLRQRESKDHNNSCMPFRLYCVHV